MLHKQSIVSRLIFIGFLVGVMPGVAMAQGTPDAAVTPDTATRGPVPGAEDDAASPAREPGDVPDSPEARGEPVSGVPDDEPAVAAAPVSTTPDVPSNIPDARAASATAAGHVTGAAASQSSRSSLLGEDVAPTITVFARDGVEVRMGGLVQVHFAPWVGDDSLVTNADTATREGFRLRRARIGMEAEFADDVRLLVVVNPVESDPDVGTVSDANIAFRLNPWLRMGLGTDKVPFTRAGLESSQSLASIERPLSVRTLMPDRRLGVTVEGAFLGDRLAVLGAFMNGTEGYELGNQFGGFLYAGRLQYALWGDPDPARPGKNGVSLGLGVLHEDGPATHTLAGSADVLVTMARASAKLEVLCDRTAPQDSPIISPGIADAIERCGAYAELGYTLPRLPIQPVLRTELFDDDLSVDDAGDVVLVSAGVNAAVRRHARIQVHYLHRHERRGNQRGNDAVVVNVQGAF